MLLSLSNKLILFGSHYWSPCIIYIGTDQLKLGQIRSYLIKNGDTPLPPFGFSFIKTAQHPPPFSVKFNFRKILVQRFSFLHFFALIVMILVSVVWSKTVLHWCSLPLKVIFTKACNTLKGVLNRRSSCIKDCLPSIKVIFHWRLPSIEEHLPSKVEFHWKVVF